MLLCIVKIVYTVIIMMMGSKGILTPLIHGFLRTLCSRKPAEFSGQETEVVFALRLQKILSLSVDDVYENMD